MKIKTTVLKELLSKASKASVNNKFLPITSLMKIQLKEGSLELETYDGRNYIKVNQGNIEGEDLYVVVNTETITKLIEKTTSEMITLEEDNNKLIVKGNGTYTIDIPMEEDSMVKFPEPQFNWGSGSKFEGKINTQVLKNMFNVNKPSLSQTLDVIALTGYYADSECLLSTNSFVATFNNDKLFETPMLLPTSFVNLITNISSEETAIYYDESNVAFVGGNVSVIGKVLEGIETYPVDTIKGLLKTEFNSMCKIPRQALIDVLDRLSIFVKEYDNNAVDIAFKEDGLILSTKKTTGTEKILYSASENFKEFKCSLDVSMLKEQLAVLNNELTEIWYGNDDAIKMIDGKVSQIIATVIEEANA